MNSIRQLAAITFLALTCVSIVSAQDKKPANPAAAPPNLVLLVHQETQYGKAGAHQKLEANTARACDRLDTPNSWIALESITGPRELLFFDPFDSFEQLEQSAAGWGHLYAAHPDLARMREEIDALVVNERTIVALRRDDLGYHADSIDLSETRYVRVLEVRLFPGHENDFVESIKILAEAHEKIKADAPWVVYQVNVGMPSPAFFIFTPLSALKQNDDFVEWKESLLAAEGEEARQHLQQIAREAYAITESNLYSVSPEMSHVSKEFAAGDPDFWRLKMQPDVKSDAKPAKRESSTKPPAH